MSLRLRLASWYAAITFLVVALVCAYSFAVHSRAHYEELDGNLAAVAEHVAKEVEAAQSAADLAGVVEASLHLGPLVRVYKSDGSLELAAPAASGAPALEPAFFLLRTSRPAYPLVASLAPKMQHMNEHRGRFDLMGDPERWRVYVVALQNEGRLLAAILPLAHIDDSVNRFGWLMALLALIGGVVSFGVGYLVAGRALHPVSSLTEAAGDIAQTREFSRRVNVSESRDELGRLAATFNEMLASLEQAYTAQKRFVSDASHELRAPLTIIQANLELLRGRGLQSASDSPEALEEAYREAGRLSRLVSDLLVLARADAGVELQKSTVELDRVVMDVLGEARHLGRGQKLEIGNIEPCAVSGDADRLRQLILNLISNAIKYTAPTGRVVVELFRNDGTAVLTVRDNGIGISGTDLPRVFERFYRADPARSGDPGGTGLGLPIALWIANRHGGDLKLQSEPGRGTTATLRLPVQG